MLDNYIVRIILFLIFGSIFILFMFRQRDDETDDIIDDISEDNIEVEYVDDFPEDIIQVPGYDYLYYNINTREVYQVFVKDDIEYLDIFTSNGRFCKYLDSKIMEVVNDEVIAIVHTAIFPN